MNFFQSAVMKRSLLLLIAFLTITTSGVFAQTVYITKTGEKYHVGDCRYLKYSKYSIDLKNAIQRGYDACGVCRPPTQVSSSSTIRKTTTASNGQAKRAISVQCSGTTQAGARCKRMTKSSNGYCWQHGGN